MPLKSKTFDIFYNLYPLQPNPLRCASACKQRSDDATSRHLFTDENGRIFTQVVIFEILYLKI